MLKGYAKKLIDYSIVMEVGEVEQIGWSAAPGTGAYQDREASIGAAAMDDGGPNIDAFPPLPMMIGGGLLAAVGGFLAWTGYAMAFALALTAIGGGGAGSDGGASIVMIVVGAVAFVIGAGLLAAGTYQQLRLIVHRRRRHAT